MMQSPPNKKFKVETETDCNLLPDSGEVVPGIHYEATSSLESTMSFSSGSTLSFVQSPAGNLGSEDSQDSNSNPSWKGCPLSSLKHLSVEDNDISSLVPSDDHIVFFKLPLPESGTPVPFPDIYTDIWDVAHVRMPNSPQSLYPVRKEGGHKELIQRWSLIEKALKKEITSVKQLQDAILSYNHRYANKWKFFGLQSLIEEEFSNEERSYFFQSVLPKVQMLAILLPHFITRPIPLLSKNRSKSLTLSQLQISCLLANAFFCTFPRRNAKGVDTEYAAYPDINFNRLFFHKEPRALEKLKCIISYFKNVADQQPDGIVTFTRQYIRTSEMPDFEMSIKKLPKLHVDSKSLIEETEGFLQVDFANKFIGGGVLGLGCVQEEIRFVLCPELLITRLFTEMLNKTEVLIVTGIEQYNTSTGYASTFEWRDSFHDTTFRDPFRRRLCRILALDALHFTKRPQAQYSPPLVAREIRKAYSGFRPCEEQCEPVPHVAVATGNWGCGAFRGNPRLKALIQLAAAGEAERDVAYFTFGDMKLRDDLADIHAFLTKQNVTVGELVMSLYQYGSRPGVDGKDLLHYLRNSFGANDRCSQNTLSSQSSEIEEDYNVNKSNPSNEKKHGSLITDYFIPKNNATTSHRGEGGGGRIGERGEKGDPMEEPICENLLEEGLLQEALKQCDELMMKENPSSD